MEHDKRFNPIGKEYSMTFSGDSDLIRFKVVGTASLDAVRRFYVSLYDCPLQIEPPFFKVVITKGGRDGNIHMKRGDVNYVSKNELLNEAILYR